MGKVMSLVVRKVNRFNVENRAHKVISQEKPVPAPKYESNAKELERVLNEFPDVVETLNKKDSELDDRLKKVYVTSDQVEHPKILSDKMKMPQNRKQPEDFEYGFLEPDPDKVSRGRCTLRQAIQFISDHQTDPKEWTATKIANQYKLKEDLVGQILAHFRTFQIYIPDKEKTEKILDARQTKKPLLESNEQEKQKSQN